MKKIKNQLDKLIVLGLTLPFLAIKIENPAQGFFATVNGGGGFEANSFGALIFFAIQNVLLPIVGIISILFIIIGGFQYIVSRGNEEQAETGKKTLTNAIIGLVITILSYYIVVIVINALKGNA